MAKAFDVIGAPFNLLGCRPTKQNTVNGLRHNDQNGDVGLSEWIEVRNSRWGANIVDRGDIALCTTITDLIATNKQAQGLSSYTEQLKQQVLASYDKGRIPITIGGDHSIAVGSVQAALDHYQMRQGKRVALIWIDAHADCNDSSVGNLHGKPVTMLMGNAHEKLESREPKALLKPNDLYYAAVRDLMPNEDAIIKQHSIINYDMAAIESHGINHVLNQLIKIIDSEYDHFYVSFDYDALDGSIFRACGTPNVGGLSAREAIHLIYGLANHDKFVGIDFVEYMPELDDQGISKQLMLKLIDAVWGYRS